MFPGGDGANIGNAHGSIVIDTRSLNDAVNAVTNAVNKINGSFKQAGSSGAKSFNDTEKSIKNIDNQIQGVIRAAQTLAGVFASIKMVELGAETSQALVAAQVRFEAITGSAQKATAQIGRIRDSAKAMGVPVNQALDTFASIAPLLQKGKSQLDAYVPVMARLAVLEPMQGLEGAAFAVRESLSNINSGLSNFRSLANRFNLSMGDIKTALKASGNDLAVALDKVLNKMGITNASAERMANTFMAATRILRDEFGRTLSNMLGPAFDALTPLIKDVTTFLATLNDAVPGAVGFVGTLGLMTAAALALSLALNKVNGALKELGKSSTFEKAPLFSGQYFKNLSKIAGTAGGAAVTGPALGIGVVLGTALAKLIDPSFELSKAFDTLKQALLIAGMGLVDIFFKIAIAVVNFISSIGELPERIKNQIEHGKFVTDAQIEAEKKATGGEPTLIQKSIDNRIAKLTDTMNNKIPAYVDKITGKITVGPEAISLIQAEINALKKQRELAGVGTSAPAVLTNTELDARINALLDIEKKSPETYQAAYDAFIKETTPISGYTAEALKQVVERLRVLRLFAQAAAPTTTTTTTTTTTATDVVDAMSEDIAKITKDYLEDIQDIETDAGEDRAKAEKDSEEKRLDIIQKYADKRDDLEKKLNQDLADAATDRDDDIQDVLKDGQEKEAKLRSDYNDNEREAAEKQYKDLERLRRDHDRNIREAAAHLDAHAIAEENRRYADQLADAEDSYKTDRAKRQKAYQDQLKDQQDADNKRIAEINAAYNKEVDQLRKKHKIALDELNTQEKREQDERIADYNERLAEIETQRVKEKALRDKKYIDELEEAGDQNAKLLNIMRRGGIDIAAEQQKLINKLLAQYGASLPNLGSFLKGLLPESLQDAVSQIEGSVNFFKNLASNIFSSAGGSAPAGTAPAVSTAKEGLSTGTFGTLGNTVNSLVSLFGGIGEKSGLTNLVNQIISAAPKPEQVNTAKKSIDFIKTEAPDMLKSIGTTAEKVTETCPAPADIGNATIAVKTVGEGAMQFYKSFDYAMNKTAGAANATSWNASQIVSGIQNWGNSMSNAIVNVYNVFRNLVNNANAAAEANKYVRSGQRVIQQFASGTSELGNNGLFYGHKGEVIINPRASDAIRRMLGSDFTSDQLANAVAGGGVNNTSSFQFNEGAVQVVLGDVGGRSNSEIIALSKVGFAQAINEFLATRGGA